MEKPLSNNMSKEFCIDRMKALIDSRKLLFKGVLPSNTLLDPYQKLEDAFIDAIEAEAAFLVSIENSGSEEK